ncbi:MAG: DUF922 domain-containing protein [Pseudomonadota bacterium]
MQRVLCAVLALGLIASMSDTAFAKPKISEKTKFYKIAGTTPAALLAEMNAKGPQGFWGYSSWYVRWTGGCKVSVEVTYTMPKLKSKTGMSGELIKEFDRFYAALWAHEKTHGGHGISAAEEIERAGCKNGNAIIKKWNAEDAKFDKRTDHGKKEGVYLR